MTVLEKLHEEGLRELKRVFPHKVSTNSLTLKATQLQLSTDMELVDLARMRPDDLLLNELANRLLTKTEED